MLEIITQKIKNCTVVVPGSKSYTHRILIAAALSEGVCFIDNCLKSEDTCYTMDALRQMGIRIDKNENKVIVYGSNGSLKPCNEAIYLGNSGTSMRLLASVAALGKNVYTITGTQRMLERPIQDLLDGLNQIGVSARSVNNNGCPPVEIKGGDSKGGQVALKCNVSSQYLSSLLLIAPYTRDGIEIKVVEGPVSKPYVDMTIDIMEKLGVSVKRDGYNLFQINGEQLYRAGSYKVESDCSQAGYFWAAAAVTGATVKVLGITKDSRQGDVHFVELFEEMGCEVVHEQDGIAVKGGTLSAIEADMSDMPDMVPTLAVVAAFAKGTTIIKNVSHLKEKESDRLGSVAAELVKMGIKAKCSDTGLMVHGGRPHGAEIDTYNDHRIAMSFAVAGLVVPDVFIRDEHCVEKSFPEFWNVFKGMFES